MVEVKVKPHRKKHVTKNIRDNYHNWKELTDVEYTFVKNNYEKLPDLFKDVDVRIDGQAFSWESNEFRDAFDQEVMYLILKDRM